MVRLPRKKAESAVRKTARKQAEKFGHWGENRACWWLRLRGWRILDRRVKTPKGEVDIVARRGKTLLFVEVKARRKIADLDLALDEWRMRRFAQAVKILLSRYHKNGDNIRIDAILLAPGHWPRHIKNIILD